MDCNEFYVYAHRKATTGEIFYIGKGKDDRAYSKKRRNKHWLNVVNKHGYFVEILADSLSEKESLLLEVETIKKYGIENLTNMTAGGVGGATYRKYTKEICIEIAKKYTTKSSWMRSPDGGAYQIASRSGWLEDCCSHMEVCLGKWTYEACLADAKRFKNSYEWNKNSPSARQMAARNGWSAKICREAGYPGRYHRPVLNVDTNTVFASLKEATKSVGLKSSASICQAIAKCGKAGGYRWAYAD